MNDRFKFRVWDKLGNNYLHNNPLCTINHIVSSHDGYVIELTPNDKHGLLRMISQDNFIREQCTGLKDKNGTLIYEGDIVKGWNGKEYIIRWCFDVYSRKSDGFAGFTKQSIINPECEYILGTEMTEIIGNCHQKDL